MVSRIFVATFVSIVIAGSPPCARGGSLSLGTHLGFHTIKGSGLGGTSEVLAWPSNALTYQPALRVAWGDQRHAHELILDSGMFLIDEGGSTLALLSGAAGYQYTWRATWMNAPFVNASLGLYREGGAERVGSSASWGGGVGMRHKVRDDHGALRFEGRVDRLAGSNDFGRPGLTMFGLRLGFDLWL
jgi:hypothetical protein